jgi:hypothetical protein
MLRSPSTTSRATSAIALCFALILPGCATERFAPRGAGEQDVYQVPSSIDATGTTDVTQALLTFFSTVPDGSTIQFAKNGMYRVEGTLEFRDRHDLTIIGDGATTFADDTAHRDRRHWRFIGGGDIAIRSLNVRGAHANAGLDRDSYHATLEAQHGFEFLGVNGVRLDSVSVTDVYGDFVYLGMHRDPTTWTSNVHITNSRFERCGRHAFALTGVRDALIENNFVDTVRYSSIDIEPLGLDGGAQRVTIRNNRFGPGRLIFFAAHGIAGLVEDITLENNRVEGGWMQITVSPPEGTRRRRFRIVGNVSDQLLASTKPLMTFRRIDGLVVRNNGAVLADHTAMTGVLVEESCDIDVGGNEFIGAAQEMNIVPYTCPTL